MDLKLRDKTHVIILTPIINRFRKKLHSPFLSIPIPIFPKQLSPPRSFSTPLSRLLNFPSGAAGNPGKSFPRVNIVPGCAQIRICRKARERIVDWKHRRSWADDPPLRSPLHSPPFETKSSIVDRSIRAVFDSSRYAGGGRGGTRARENGRSHLAVVKDGNGEVSGIERNERVPGVPFQSICGKYERGERSRSKILRFPYLWIIFINMKRKIL